MRLTVKGEDACFEPRQGGGPEIADICCHYAEGGLLPAGPRRPFLHASSPEPGRTDGQM